METPGGSPFEGSQRRALEAISHYAPVMGRYMMALVEYGLTREEALKLVLGLQFVVMLSAFGVQVLTVDPRHIEIAPPGVVPEKPSDPSTGPDGGGLEGWGFNL